MRAFNTFGYGVHSPFFFDLINNLQRNKSKIPLVYNNAAETRRRELLRDRSKIWVDDYGTGRSCYRRVCDIASGSSVSPRYGVLLGYFAARAGEGPIIELGTSLGTGTLYLAEANRQSVVVTVEGSESLAQMASSGFRKAGFDNIEMITGDFDNHIGAILKRYPSPGLVFIDGNHRGEALLRYFDSFAAAASRHTVIIADDIDYSGGMSDAWKELRKDKRVTASVDLGRMGLLFFRDESCRRGYRVWY
ncbi:MAG: class I SAM-dependent methyltransferase [Bacteroidales bacterium]